MTTDTTPQWKTWSLFCRANGVWVGYGLGRTPDDALVCYAREVSLLSEQEAGIKDGKAWFARTADRAFFGEANDWEMRPLPVEAYGERSARPYALSASGKRMRLSYLPLRGTVIASDATLEQAAEICRQELALPASADANRVHEAALAAVEAYKAGLVVGWRGGESPTLAQAA